MEKVTRLLASLPFRKHSPISPTRFRPLPTPSPLPPELQVIASEQTSKWWSLSTRGLSFKHKQLMSVPTRPSLTLLRTEAMAILFLPIPSIPGSSKPIMPTSRGKVLSLLLKLPLLKHYGILPIRRRPSSTRSLPRVVPA